MLSPIFEAHRFSSRQQVVDMALLLLSLVGETSQILGGGIGSS